jgi:hypothetical protein
LKEAPERFGLYNNGITIVVGDFKIEGGKVMELIEPYVVNGCQTTRSIREVCRQRLETGGTGEYKHPYIVIAAGIVKCLVNEIVNFPVYGIHHRRSVQCYGCDVVLLFVKDISLCHLSLLPFSFG